MIFARASVFVDDSQPPSGLVLFNLAIRMASVAQPGAVEKDMQSRERRELMTSILQSLRNEEIASNEPAGALGSIPAQLSAFLWLADIDRLRAIEGEWRGHASKARLVLSGTLNQSRILSTCESLDGGLHSCLMSSNLISRRVYSSQVYPERVLEPRHSPSADPRQAIIARL